MIKRILIPRAGPPLFPGVESDSRRDLCLSPAQRTRAMDFAIKTYFSKFIRNSWHFRNFSGSSCLHSDKPPEEAIPKNLLEEKLGSHLQPKGIIYDSRPFRMTLQANKKYAWCSCGHSKSQPLCDGTHKIPGLKISNVPIFFMVAETKEYWLCNCKQSDHRPFCDGTHKDEKIKGAIKVNKM